MNEAYLMRDRRVRNTYTMQINRKHGVFCSSHTVPEVIDVYYGAFIFNVVERTGEYPTHTVVIPI